MNISKIETPAGTPITELGIGDFFEYQEDLFIIIDDTSSIDALMLKTGDVIVFSENNMVIPIPSDHINIRYYH